MFLAGSRVDSGGGSTNDTDSHNRVVSSTVHEPADRHQLLHAVQADA